MKHVIGRRRLLRGLVGGAAVGIALPRLGAMLDDHGEAYAAGGALPRVFGMWGFGNGVILPRWIPKQTGTGWDLSEELAPLAAVREYVSIVSGTDLPYNGRAHAAGHTIFVTGGRMAGGGDSAYTARGPSIDQIVAQHIAPGTALRSLEVGVDRSDPPERGTAFHWWSHNGPNSPNPCSYSCREVLGRIVSPGAAGGADAVARAARLRKSVLDAVLEDGRDLGKQLGAADARRLEQHLEGIRAIEKRIESAAAPAAGNSCKAPPSVPDLAGYRGDYATRGPAVNRTMAELVTLALACDVTRVFTFEFTQPSSRFECSTLRLVDHHIRTHERQSQELVHRTTVYIMSQLAVLLEAMKATPDGAGNLLDRAAIVVGTDCSEGFSHSIKNFPALVIGKAGGRLRGGVHHAAPGENSLRILLSMARAVGAPLDEFGIGPGAVREGLSALEA